MPAEWWEPSPADGPRPKPRKARRWRDKFREAFRGIKLGVRGHSSFSVHFFFAALALTAALVLECDRVEWCLVVGCIGLVFTAELLNSAVETLFHGLDPEAKARIHGCLDIAAGAVLVAGLTAAAVGTIVFGHKLLVLFHRLPTS
jgi:diacylglycerol kinase